MKKWQDNTCVFFGSAFGLGLLPIAPGSFGALLGVAMHVGIARWVGECCQLWALVACLAGVCVTHFILTPWAQRYWNDSDPGNFVLDEVAGYLTVPIALMAVSRIFPNAPTVKLLPQVIAGFLIFRIFDIIKLPGARYIDRNWHNAWGVLLDDIISGLYAAITIGLAAWLLSHF